MAKVSTSIKLEPYQHLFVKNSGINLSQKVREVIDSEIEKVGGKQEVVSHE